MEISSIKWGQQEVPEHATNLDHTRVIILPNIPINERDLNLGQVYARSMKVTTFQTMYSRWLAAEAPHLRKKHPAFMHGDVDVLVLNINNAGVNYAPVAYTAAVYVFVQTVLADSQQIQRIEFRPIALDPRIGSAEQPLLVALLRPSGNGLLSEPFFTGDDVVNLLSYFGTNLKGA